MIDSQKVSSVDGIRQDYSSRQQSFEAAATSSGRKSTWALVASGTFAAFVIVVFLARIGAHPAFNAFLLIPALVALRQIQLFLRYRRHAVDAARRAMFYERGTLRLDGAWPGKGNPGSDFAHDHHPYQNDLDILGDGSLFELLATVRSDAGAERLSKYLLDPVNAFEARARQEAVKELCSEIALREEIDVIGKYRFHDCSRRKLRGWLDQPLLRSSNAIPVVLALLSLISVSLVVAVLLRLSLWSALVPVLSISLAGQGAISIPFKRQVNTRIEVLRTLATDISLLLAGMEVVASLKFRSPKLAKITECLSARDANKAVSGLARLLKYVECREDAILYGFLLWIAAGTQLVLAIERWRGRNQVKFDQLLDAWAEFEALSALAGYAYEHPDDIFPDLIDRSAQFEVRNMGHPLLPYRACVTNDIALDDSTRFYIISGSNMSGKSTLLRAIGLNAVLAAAGAPVRAEQARIAVMSVCASIVIADSLRDGASKFFAEVARLRDSIAMARSGEPVLFLVDEMLAGTNSRDRCMVARCMVETLIAAGAVGALSTHDLALTEIAQQKTLRGINTYMQSRRQDNPLDFDYCLRAGIATQTNGIAIVRMMGLQV